MKRLFLAILTGTVLLSAAACGSGQKTGSDATEKTTESATEAVVVFTDEILEKRVREIMNRPTGDITIAEAEAVENLDLSEKAPSTPSPRIKDISALKYFKNLKGLDLSYHNIEDLSPIAGMTELEGLCIWGAESITDYSALASLTNMLDLTIAGMNGTKFKNSDMQLLAGMTKIEMIWLQGARELTDISVVSNFKNLYRLNVDYTGVSDISPAAGITSLVQMDLRGTGVKDISPLKNLTNLRELWLEGCPIEDYSPIEHIYPNLTTKDFVIE